MTEKYLCDNVPINDKFDKNCVKIDDNNLNSDKHLLHVMDKEKQFFVCNGVYVYNRGSCVMNPDIQKLITNPQSNIGASGQPVVQPEVQPPPVVIQPETPIVIQPAFTEMTGKYCGPFPGDAACKTDDTSDKCYPKSTLDECKASCGNDCSGISYDAGRKWCIKCDNLNDVKSHGAWGTHKNDNHSVGDQPVMLDEPIYKGCYQDGALPGAEFSSHRTLPTHHSGNLTKDQCRDKAKEQKHKYFGLQYWEGDGNIMTGQCFSGNELPKDKIDGCKSGGTYNVGGGWENAVYSFVKEEVNFVCKDQNLPNSEGTSLSGGLANNDGGITREQCINKCKDTNDCNGLAYKRNGTRCYIKKDFDSNNAKWDEVGHRADFDYCYMNKQEQLTPQLGSSKTSDGYCTNEASKTKINNFIECEKSCMDDNTCKGFAYLPGSNRQCIKSNDNCTNTSQHPDFKWVSFNMNK